MLFVTDTCLPTDAVFSSGLVVHTPVSDLPLNWTSDDSDTEQLISAAEQLLSLHDQPRFDIPAAVNKPAPAEAALAEPHLSGSSIAESASAEPFLGNLASVERAEDGDVPVLQLSRKDLVLQQSKEGPVYQLLPQVLHSLHRLISKRRSEPTVTCDTEPWKLKHQASAPGKLQEAAASAFVFTEMSEVPTNSVVHQQIEETPEIPAPCHADQAAVVSTISSMASEPNTMSLCPSRAVPLVTSTAGSRLPSDSLGARPKVRSPMYQIPTFVEDEILSEEEEDMADFDVMKYSPSAVVSSGQSVQRLMTGGSMNLLIGNMMSQFPVDVMAGGLTSSELAISVPLLAELDLRNNDELVSVDNVTSINSLICKTDVHCVSKKGPTLKRYSSKLYGSILMIFGGNIQKSLE